MPYQVVKRVGKRAYRYEVTSFRDPKSGKSKGVWKYLGRCERVEASAPTAVPPTRERLLDAFIELLRETSYAELTIERIAKRAGVTKATLYRHFRDKRAMLFALVGRMKERLRPTAVLVASDDPARERERIKSFIRNVATMPAIRDGVARAMLEMQFKDESIRAFWQRFMGERESIWSSYIAGLNEFGVGYGDDPAMLASVLSIIGEGVRQLMALRRTPLSDAEIDLLGDVIGRVLVR
jgi:AcrR family transcriptional regulator